MSWSVSATFATKEAVRESLQKQFDSAATNYEETNPEEAKDVRAAQERAMQGLEAFTMPTYRDSANRTFNAISVSAYGSRSSCSVDMHLHIEPAVVEVPAPPETKPEG